MNAINYTNELYYLALGLLVLLSVSVVGNFMFFVRESEMRTVINCASFSSYGEVYTFMQDNPQYAKQLDRNHDGIPCQIAYGNV